MKNVNPIPHNVPLGMDTLGFFRSPDILAPANTPAVAGKKTPNTLAIVSFFKGFALPAAPDVNLGHKFSLRVSNEIPVYLIIPPDRVESENALTVKDDKGIENDDTIRTRNRNPEARENALDPTNEIIVTTSNITDAYRNSHQPPYD